MTPRLVVRSAAEADIADAALRYEARASGLGSDFLRVIDVTLAEIRRMPERFPYAAYFVPSADLISVVGCMHARRDPRRWEERVGE